MIFFQEALYRVLLRSKESTKAFLSELRKEATYYSFKTERSSELEEPILLTISVKGRLSKVWPQNQIL